MSSLHVESYWYSRVFSKSWLNLHQVAKQAGHMVCPHTECICCSPHFQLSKHGLVEAWVEANRRHEMDPALKSYVCKKVESNQYIYICIIYLNIVYRLLVQSKQTQAVVRLPLTSPMSRTTNLDCPQYVPVGTTPGNNKLNNPSSKPCLASAYSSSTNEWIFAKLALLRSLYNDQRR